MTSSAGTVLESISRKSILEVADVIGVESFEGRLPPELFYEADEIFLSSTAGRVVPVRKIEDRMLEETPGPLTRKLLALMGEIEAGRDERFKDWLFPVD